MTNSPLKEEFIHFLWRTKKLPIDGFVTTDGKVLEILDFGIYNVDAGPDFFTGKIKIDGTIWAGNIEMHVFSSDWQKHKHQHDSAYDNVVLHVVYEDDKPVLNTENIPIPTLALKGKIPKIYLDNYLNLVQSQQKITCESIIHKVSKEKINFWKFTLAVERLSNKSSFVNDILTSTGHDWEETLYVMIARYFGSKVNTEPFERLARSLPLQIVQKNKDKRPAALAARIIAARKARGVDLVIDYEHGTVLKAKQGDKAPAAGWATADSLEYRSGVGLVSTAPQWTPVARAHLDAREYRYGSPVIFYDPKTGDVTGLHSFALTNDPGLSGVQTALSASDFSSQENHEVNPLLAALIASLGLPAGTTDDVVITAVTALKAKAVQADTEIATLPAAAPDPAAKQKATVTYRTAHTYRTRQKPNR